MQCHSIVILVNTAPALALLNTCYVKNVIFKSNFLLFIYLIWSQWHHHTSLHK